MKKANTTSNLFNIQADLHHLYDGKKQSVARFVVCENAEEALAYFRDYVKKENFFKGDGQIEVTIVSVQLTHQKIVIPDPVINQMHNYLNIE